MGTGSRNALAISAVVKPPSVLKVRANCESRLRAGWRVVVEVGVRRGRFRANALAYGRMQMLGSNIIGRIVLLGLIVLPLWKGAHHLRSLAVDFGGGDRDAIVGSLLYLIAIVGSLLGIVAVIRL